MKNLLYLSFLFLTVLAFGQERTVFGNVTSSEDGTPLSFLTIMIENTNKATQTDLDGNYSIMAIPNDTLVFSFVGLETQNIKADKEEINVIMGFSGNGR